ncbi:probable disease resistance protein RF45 [Tanacetum coccineum]
MAVEVVVSVVIHKLANLITEESQTFEKVIDEVQSVVAKLRDMQSILNHAEHQEQTNDMITDWVMQSLSKVYCVVDAIETFVLAETRLKRMGFFKKHSFVIANEYKLCREVPEEMDCCENVSRLKSRMKRISKEIEKWKDGFPSLALIQDPGPQRRHQHEPWQKSNSFDPPKREKAIFKKDVDNLMRQITGDNKPLEIICVYGEDGIGKTAHVKKIYNKLEVKRKFAFRSLVVVQTKWSIRHLLMAILQQVISMQGKEKLKDEDLIVRLNNFLLVRNYLIIINDVKSLDLLIQLKRALPNANNGSRVVITTSNEHAASFEYVSSHYHFKPLDIEDGFSLIAMLAGLLSTRKPTYKAWTSVFEQQDFATKSPSFDLHSFEEDLKYLRRLFRLWLAEGFVKLSRDIIPEDIVEGYLEELVKRNMVEITKRRSDGSPKKCRMIGLLHDIFLPRAVELGLFHLHQKPDGHSNATAEHRFKIRRVVEYTNIKEYSNSKDFNQNLQSYISFNGRKKDMPAEEVGRFLEKIIGARGFGLLKVLDLEGVYRPRLPENLGSLFHLRWTFLDALPSSLGDLLYLETLDIKHTHITTLPSSIWNMKHLHYLCLNGARLDISAQSNKHRE